MKPYPFSPAKPNGNAIFFCILHFSLFEFLLMIKYVVVPLSHSSNPLFSLSLCLSVCALETKAYEKCSQLCNLNLLLQGTSFRSVFMAFLVFLQVSRRLKPKSTQQKKKKTKTFINFGYSFLRHLSGKSDVLALNRKQENLGRFL